MSFDKAKKALTEKGYGNRVSLYEESCATVELAAKTVGTETQRIAKSLTFMVGEDPIMIVCAGDSKINGGKFRRTFGVKSKMIDFEDVSRLIGHDVGGVCPFGVNEGVKIYLDESLKRFDTVYPASGSENSMVRLTISELEDASDYEKWVDVTKLQD